MRPTLVVHEGQYCVADTVCAYTEPTWLTRYYPTGIRAVNSEWWHPLLERFIGEPLRWGNNGRLILPNDKLLELADGRDTKPIHVTEEPIKPPTRARGWEWYCGEWRRHTARGLRRISYV